MQSRRVEFVSDFSIERITPNGVIAGDGRAVNCDLAVIIPPFSGPGAVLHTSITDADGYVPVEKTMRVPGVERMYAVGDCVSFPGPKMGHMAVSQAEVAAENLWAEIQGRALPAAYEHELKMVLETDGKDSIYLHKDLWTDDPAHLKPGQVLGVGQARPRAVLDEPPRMRSTRRVEGAMKWERGRPRPPLGAVARMLAQDLASKIETTVRLNSSDKTKSGEIFTP